MMEKKGPGSAEKGRTLRAREQRQIQNVVHLDDMGLIPLLCLPGSVYRTGR